MVDLPLAGVALRAGITVARRALRPKGFAMPRSKGPLSAELPPGRAV
ncbi:hypothetical protein [Streptomyces sp. NPDC007346]